MNLRFIKNLKGTTTAKLPKEIESYPKLSIDVSPFQTSLEGNDPQYSLKLPKDSTLEASLFYADEIPFKNQSLSSGTEAAWHIFEKISERNFIRQKELG